MYGQLEAKEREAQVGIAVPDQTKKQCPGSPRFLAWLAKHNRVQSSLEDANRTMGWANRPDARHGVDCACVDEPDKESRSWGWFNDLFR